MYYRKNRYTHLNDLEDISREHSCARRGVGYAIQLVCAVLRERHFPKATGRIPLHYYLCMRRDFPCEIHSTEIPGVQILLNRQGNPLGSNQSYSYTLRYEDYPNLHTKLTPAQIARVCSPLPTQLFDDGNPPWKGRREARKYMERLEQLALFLEDDALQAMHDAPNNSDSQTIEQAGP